VKTNSKSMVCNIYLFPQEVKDHGHDCFLFVLVIV